MDDTSNSASDRTRLCLSNLKAVVLSTSGLPRNIQRINPQQAQDHLERLSLWASNIGALNKPNSRFSLEYRLREEEEVLELLLNLLSDLKEVTSELLEISSGERENKSDLASIFQDVDGPQSEADILLKETRTCITRLFQVSNIIRKASTTDIFSKAVRRNSHLFKDNYDISHVQAKFPKLATEDSSWLGRRLGRAITQRRRYLRYTQEHHTKLENTQQERHPQFNDSVAIAYQKLNQHIPNSTGTLPDTSSRPSGINSHATTLRPGQIAGHTLAVDNLGQEDDEDETRTYTTVTRSEEGDDEVPIFNRIPNLNDLRKGDGNNVECPLCFRMKTLKNEKKLRKHVFSDLHSYVCTFPGCEDLYFGDINEWFAHEMGFHRVDFRCPLCELEHRTYKTKERYISHVKIRHPGLYENSDEETVLSIAQEATEKIPAQDCPFCDDWVYRIRQREKLPAESANNEIFVSPPLFKRHLASHMEQLALFALPIESDSNEALARHERLMKSLIFPQINERLYAINSPFRKTYEWVLKHPTFRHWQGSDEIPKEHRMIWIKGKPGTGKSTLMKFAYNRIRESVGKTTFITSFFFNARGHDLEKTVLGMYRSLLWQLLNQFPDLQTVFDNTSLLSRNQETYSLVELRGLLQSAVLSLGERALFWFIDALDECKEGQITDMVYFFKEIYNSALDKGVNFGICFSSRHYPTINIQGTQELILDCHPDHANDLKTYTIRTLYMDNHDIIEEILKKASGVFLWVVLVVEMLNESFLRGEGNIKQRLEELPDNLRFLLEDTIGRSTGDNIQDETMKLSMLWLLFAKEPLNPTQYIHAVWAGLLTKGLLGDEPSPIDMNAPDAQSRAEKYVVNSSKGFAQVAQTESDGKQVQLLHESIRDFLLKGRGLSQLWPELADNVVGLSHATLQQSCMEYWKYWLEAASRSPSLASENQNGLKDYVVRNILDHAEAATDACSQQDFLVNFPLSSYIAAPQQAPHPRTNFKAKYNLEEGPVDLLYILAYEGYAKLIIAFLQLEDVGHRTAERTRRHRLPALAAAAMGHLDALEALLTSRTDIYVGADLFDSDTLEVVSTLGFKSGYYEHSTPLSWAAFRGFTQMVSKLLLKYQHPVNERDSLERTPLSEAATHGHEATAKLLIEQGADINAGNPLNKALRYGHEATARLLIEKGADINATDSLSRTAMAYASRCGHANVIESLLRQGKGDIARADSYGNTPLDAAVRNRHYYVVDLLLRNGARLTGTNNLANTSLLGWARLGCENDDGNAILRLLNSYTAGINSSIRDDPAPAGYEAVPFEVLEAWCDNCTITIAANAKYYACKICGTRMLVICCVCWRRGIRCLDNSHTLGEQIIETAPRKGER